jgi:long-chain-fatty-acyl-CoA reductase
MKTLDLTILMRGTQVLPTQNVHSLRYENGIEIRLAAPSRQDVSQMLAADGASLRALSIDDVTLFFDAVGKNWRAPHSKWRNMVLDLAALTTGYARSIVEWDANMLSVTLDRPKQYDFIETDLGDAALLDEWRASRAVHQRVYPKGTIAHIMVGNVPMASLFTLYRSLVTKNVTIAKVPSRDAVTALAFANCIHDTDPDHPVTKALSALYWEPNSEVEDLVLSSVDVVSAWGQRGSMEAIKRRVPAGVDFIEFGPKRSLSIVLSGESDYDTLGMKMAYDVVMYDQEACFSLAEAYVDQTAAPSLVDSLTSWFKRYAETMPRRRMTVDQEAHIQRARLDAGARGWRVVSPKNTDWTVVITEKGTSPVEQHPSGRCLYIHPFDDVRDAIRAIDREVQTVSVAPWERRWELVDAIADAGADRIVQVGRMARMRPGFIHDGFHPMRRMVRWVAIERGLEYKYKFFSRSQEDDTQMVYRMGVRDPH